MTLPGPSPSGPTGPDTAGLRRFLLADLVACVFASTLVTVLWVVLPPSPTYPLVVAIPLLTASVIGVSLRALAAGRVRRAVLLVAVANWGAALSLTTIVTFVWPLMLLVALMPCVLAISFLDRWAIRLFLVVSFTVGLATVAVGLLSDLTTFTEDAPATVRNILLIVIMPIITTLVGFLALSASERYQQSVQESRAAQEAVAEHARELTASRARVVAAGDRARREIERDLHDGAQQRLVAMKLHLARARLMARTDPEATAELLEMLVEEAGAAHRELRDLSQGVYPPVLAEHGLSAALTSLADRGGVAVVTDIPVLPRAPAQVEAAVYFGVNEALVNVAKHAGGGATARLSAGVDGVHIWFEVADDGVGFDPAGVQGSGLVNLHDRVGAVGGELRILAEPGGGTTVHGRLPLDP